MKRALVSTFVVLSLLACSPFGSSEDSRDTPNDGPDASTGADARAPDASSSGSPDAATVDFCANTIACDRFDGSYGAEWRSAPGDLYQPHVDDSAGVLVCALAANNSTDPTPNDSCKLERSLPANVKMRIEFDLTFDPPNDYRGHNIQVFAIYNGADETRTYLGLYVQNPGTGKASLALTLAQAATMSSLVAAGSIVYGVKTHIALDVSFGAGSAILFEGATPSGSQSFASTADPPVVRLGLSRQNGGTDALRGQFDDFRVTKIEAF